MKRLSWIIGIVLLFAGANWPIEAQPKKMPTEKTVVDIPKIGKKAHFIPRDKLRPTIQLRRAVLPNRAVPATVLPVDGTNNRKVSCPMYVNDQYGSCGEAMAGHTIGILSYGQGKRTEILFTDQEILKQYLQVSGGDNGMSEDMEVGPQGVFTVGVCGHKDCIAVSSMDVDPNDVQLVQYLLDQFYTLQLAWSVPNAFINNFQSGQSYLEPMNPNPNNGHYTTISDITKDGNYTLWTWGGWAEVSQRFIASVEPSYFVVFSPVQFDPTTGFDSHGRHITTQAAVWVSLGGGTIPQSVINAFPPAAPLDDKAPYKLYEGDMKAPILVGIPGGYLTLPSAEADARNIATKDQKAVMVHDKAGAMVETIQPGVIPPAPTTFTITLPAYTIPGQAITLRGPFGRTYSGSTAPVTAPAQTVTGTLNPTK